MKEIDHQTNIKLSVKAQGGFSMKLSNRFTVGVPDLLIMMPSFVPCFMEVKDLKEVVDDFDMQLNVSPKQNLTMKQMNDAYEQTDRYIGKVAFVAVVLKWRKTNIITVLSQGSKRLSAKLLREELPWWGRIPGKDGSGPTYNMPPLLQAAHVPKIKRWREVNEEENEEENEAPSNHPQG